MHKLRPAPGKHVAIDPLGVGVAFAKDRRFMSRLHFEKTRFRRHIAFIAVIAVKMVRRQVDERRSIASERMHNIDLVA